MGYTCVVNINSDVGELRLSPTVRSAPMNVVFAAPTNDLKRVYAAPIPTSGVLPNLLNDIVIQIIQYRYPSGEGLNYRSLVGVLRQVLI